MAETMRARVERETQFGALTTPELRREREFTAVVVHLVEARATKRFGRMRDAARADDLIRESVALAWVEWLRVILEGKEPSAITGHIAKYAVLAVARGERLTLRKGNRDPFNESHRFLRANGAPVSLSAPCQGEEGLTLEETLRARKDCPLDTVQAKLDWARFLTLCCSRDRRILELSRAGHGNAHIGALLGLNRVTVQQIKRRLKLAYLSLS
jgi:hypothetical protein